MQNVRSILFDLDGTLTDSAEGIIKAYSYAFRKVKVKAPDKKTIKLFIGSPLRQNIRDYVPPEKVEECVDHYFNFYDAHRVGFTDNRVYDGILETLEALSRMNMNMYVVTAKLADLALPIVHMFGLDAYLKNVYGAKRKGVGSEKKVLIERALKGEKLDPKTTVMVGDRKFDIEAAKKAGIRNIAVTWGYGSLQELKEAEPDVILSHPNELISVFSKK